MTLADQLTVARAASAAVVVLLFSLHFPNHDYWGTAVFCVAMSTDWFDGRIARRSGRTTSFGSLLDPVADKVLVLATLIVLLDQGVFPAWMVAAIVARELLVSGLRLAALLALTHRPAGDTWWRAGNDDALADPFEAPGRDV
jgi:CDP-diacylglycerol---glycerol-3-phosphate 3-phosphatidyltransferase